MSNTATKLVPAYSVKDPTLKDDPKLEFETAIARIQHCGEPAGPSRPPIAVRKGTIQVGDHATEKRALTEAARALARLWKVSPTMAR